MEEPHIIITYQLNQATILDLCALMDPVLKPANRNQHAIPTTVQVLSVLHFKATGSLQVTVGMTAAVSQPMSSHILSNFIDAFVQHLQTFVQFPQRPELTAIKSGFYAFVNIPHMIGAIDGTHIALIPPRVNEQVYRNRDYGYLNMQWLLTPVRNPRTDAERNYNEAHGHTRRVIECTKGLLKARFSCLHLSGGSLCYVPDKVCKIVVACGMLLNLAVRKVIPLLEEEGAVQPALQPQRRDEIDGEEKEGEDINSRTQLIRLYFQ
ncbi:putative nuclease HARBI1 [Pleurodeles waltl]|uniref:putative nuclease HARBI1 n=1 Tax=Pleurodeles waltl TaxID=8319 RepID=UPI003709BA86